MPSGIAIPPTFVRWKSVPSEKSNGWQRQWFGNELAPAAVFNVRGVGSREPTFNPNADAFLLFPCCTMKPSPQWLGCGSRDTRPV